MRFLALKNSSCRSLCTLVEVVYVQTSLAATITSLEHTYTILILKKNPSPFTSSRISFRKMLLKENHWSIAKALIQTSNLRIGMISDILDIADDMMYVDNIIPWQYYKFPQWYRKTCSLFLVCTFFFAFEVEGRYFMVP